MIIFREEMRVTKATKQLKFGLGWMAFVEVKKMGCCFEWQRIGWYLVNKYPYVMTLPKNVEGGEIGIVGLDNIIYSSYHVFRFIIFWEVCWHEKQKEMPFLAQKSWNKWLP